MPIIDLKNRFGVVMAGASLAAAIGLVALYWLLQLLIDWQVRTSLLENAGLKAQLWSEHVMASINEPGRVFQSGVISPGDIRFLEASFSTVELLRFELFDGNGKRFYSSAPEILGPQEELNDGRKFRDAHDTGNIQLGFFRNVNNRNQDEPVSIVEAYLPATDAYGNRIGVIEVQFDVTKLEKALTGAFRKISWLLILGTMMLVAFPASALIYRTRQVWMRDKRLLELMRFDQLTGVLNRNSVQEAINDMFRDTNKSVSLGILFIDVDHFKKFNDEHGHAGGDAVLRHLAERLKASVRQDRDIVARFGGDEFLVVIREVDMFELRTLYARIMENASQPCRFEGKTFFPSLSVGVYLTCPGDSAKTAFRRADLAVYAAKKRGRSQVIEYSAELEDLFRPSDLEPQAPAPDFKPA